MRNVVFEYGKTCQMVLRLYGLNNVISSISVECSKLLARSFLLNNLITVNHNSKCYFNSTLQVTSELS